MYYKIGICQGSRCRDYGGQYLLEQLQQNNNPVEALQCQSLCTYSPIVKINGKAFLKATINDIFIENNNNNDT